MSSCIRIALRGTRPPPRLPCRSLYHRFLSTSPYNHREEQEVAALVQAGLGEASVENDDAHTDDDAHDNRRPQGRNTRRRHGDEGGAPEASTMREFIERIAPQFKHARDFSNWYGDGHPFPMNPSFTPPPPLADEARESIFKAHSWNPRYWTVRRLSQHFSVSMKRVEAIIRLKTDEYDNWKKPGIIAPNRNRGKRLPVQTGFTYGMEKVLNIIPSGIRVDLAAIESETKDSVQNKVANDNDDSLMMDDDEAEFDLEESEADGIGEEDERFDGTKEGVEAAVRQMGHPRKNVMEADDLEEMENRDFAPQPYVRSYWESIDEVSGSQPIVPSALEHAKRLAERRHQQTIKYKESLIPRLSDNNDSYFSKPKNIELAQKKGRPDITFVDVGAKYLMVEEEQKRLATARKRAATARKRLEIRKSMPLNKPKLKPKHMTKEQRQHLKEWRQMRKRLLKLVFIHGPQVTSQRHKLRRHLKSGRPYTAAP